MATTDDRGTDAVDVTARTEVLDGDDIVVVPSPEPFQRRAGTRRPSRRVLAGLIAAAAILAAAGVAAALAARDESKPAVRTTPGTDAGAPRGTGAPRAGATPASRAGAPATGAPGGTAPPAVVSPGGSTPPASDPVVSQPTSPPPTATSVPTATTAPQSAPISVLHWDVPASVTVQTGATVTVKVSAHNPSQGVVALPRPLSCVPRLQHDEVCVQVVQYVAPDQTVNATWPIDATGVAPGVYTLDVEGVRTIEVTVTAAS